MEPTADPSQLRDLAAQIFTPRQYEIWDYHSQGYTQMQIAQILRLSPRTIRYDLHAMRLAAAEARAAQREGPITLSVTTATNANGFNRSGEGVNPSIKPDTVAMEAHARLQQRERRRQAVWTD